MVSNQNSKPTEIESAANLMLCSSCAGWHYGYCDLPLKYVPVECYEFLRDGKIVKCPYEKYNFIPTKHFGSRAQVVKAFPENF